tara:strand:- start:32 stop:265 length:234 start_codon:yes stop_codon:yes gene_type:complete
MKNVNTKKAKTVKPSVKAGTLTFVSGKARTEENTNRAKAVNGFTYEKALAYYGTLYPKGAKTHLNYDLNKIKSLKLS